MPSGRTPDNKHGERSRDLNKVSVKDAYPIPHVECLLMRLSETLYIRYRPKGCILADNASLQWS